MGADALFVSEREVPPEWTQDLNRLNPGGEHVSRLVLAWLPGKTYEPIQRWGVYEVVPQEHVLWLLRQEQDPFTGKPNTDSVLWHLWSDLKGQDPATWGEWKPDDLVPGKRRWHSDSLVSHTQWVLHRQTGGLPLLVWVIQGTRGGHMWQLGQSELGWLQSFGLSPQQLETIAEAIPLPGSLPYAPYDQRVFQALAVRDKLRKWAGDWSKRSATKTDAGLYVAQDRTARKRQYNGEMLKWIETQIEDALLDIPRHRLPSRSDLPAGETDLTDADALDAAFIDGA